MRKEIEFNRKYYPYVVEVFFKCTNCLYKFSQKYKKGNVVYYDSGSWRHEGIDPIKCSKCNSWLNKKECVIERKALDETITYKKIKIIIDNFHKFKYSQDAFNNVFSIFDNDLGQEYITSIGILNKCWIRKHCNDKILKICWALNERYMKGTLCPICGKLWHNYRRMSLMDMMREVDDLHGMG